MRASLIQILLSVRSERQLMQQMQYNLLFRWFVGLGVDDPVWVPTVFTEGTRDRLLTTDMSRKFLAALLAHREVAPLLSDEHFSVDGTLVKAWASMKSFQPKPTTRRPMTAFRAIHPPPRRIGGTSSPPRKPRRPPQNQHQNPPQRTPRCPGPPAATATPKSTSGRAAVNATHASTTDPDARLFRKSRGTGAILCFMGHTLMENRNGLIVQADSHADGHAERRAALDMIHRPVRNRERAG